MGDKLGNKPKTADGIPDQLEDKIGNKFRHKTHAGRQALRQAGQGDKPRTRTQHPKQGRRQNKRQHRRQEKGGHSFPQKADTLKNIEAPNSKLFGKNQLRKIICLPYFKRKPVLRRSSWTQRWLLQFTAVLPDEDVCKRCVFQLGSFAFRRLAYRLAMAKRRSAGLLSSPQLYAARFDLHSVLFLFRARLVVPLAFHAHVSRSARRTKKLFGMNVFRDAHVQR